MVYPDVSGLFPLASFIGCSIFRIDRGYTESEAIANQINYKRFELFGKTIPWMGLTFPCWTESIVEQKKGDKKIKFDAILRVPSQGGVLGISFNFS